VNLHDVRFAPSALKELENLPNSVVARIRAVVGELAREPRPRGCKKLQGEEDTYRIRVGDYRVIYEVHDDQVIVLIIRVRHRKDAYR
jgi:mRNA interferase RelE/StbE